MQNDDIVWSIINRSFCSFKVSTSTQNFCRETNNVTGLCSRTSCPLANSQYATVREEKGICYLYIKTAERHYFPVKQWEKIKLSKNFKTALRQIDENLILYKKYFRQKCRQRLLKLTQIIVRMRKQALDPEKKLIPIRRKIDLRIKRREQKALVAAKTDLAIEKKLLERLKEGVYGGIYNFCPTAFEEVTKEAEEEKEVESYKVVGGEREEEGEKSKIKKKVMKIMDKEIEQEEDEDEDEEVEEREFVADFEESENEEDIEDIEF
ncbi:Protein MAK16-like protein A [Armadillidium nasatum]|uniref:Protein MAK16 homolog n=1 Tax=Armadillidium nasatum TaxID=96803 RepID=A0A5N5TGK0_9CRUS|nr:Protein MAK16-like protein A [Armadillidium nasatum]